MSKFAAKAALVIGGVALVASGVGALAGAGLIGASASVAAATGAVASTTIASIATTVATYASLAAGVASLAASLTAHRPTQSGNPDEWSANPDAGIPIAIGRTYCGGQIVYRHGYGPKNKYETIITVLSLGPIQSIDTLYVDKKATAITGQTVEISDRGKMYANKQLGQCPEAAALTVQPVAIEGWGPQSKLSGKAATAITFVYDVDGSNTFTSTPEVGWGVHGVKGYDPRQDSTHPGGSGGQRIDNEATWAWSENPYVMALTWCIGWRQNGKLAAGVGLPVSGILLDQFIEGANVADANGWKVGGVVYTTDDKWDVLKNILQAGGGEPVRLGALVGCIIDTPRVSLATITEADVLGDVSVTAMQARRDRINALVPRYRDEDSQWSDVAAAPIIVDEYVTADGRQRRKEVSYPLVQKFAGGNLSQVSQLARYDVENAREFGPISLPLRLRWMGYKPGDCVTANLPECGLAGQSILLTGRSLDAGSAVVTMTARSETTGKHAFALGQTTTPPAPPALTTIGYNPLLDIIAAATPPVSNAIATSFPIGLSITAHDGGSITISSHTRRYTDGHADVAVTGATIASGLAAGAVTSLYYDDLGRLGGAVTYGLDPDDIDAHVSPDNPGRHYVGYAIVPTAGSPPASGGGANPPGGGYCVTFNTPILLADRTTKPAGEIAVGDRLWTRHEASLAWGEYPVEGIEIVDSDDVWEATIGGQVLRATGDHLVYTGAWVAMRTIGERVEAGRVVKMTVTGAHTYVSNGVLSHNAKQFSAAE